MASEDDGASRTRAGVLRTVLYSAPESMDRPQDADARADVYGLGMTAGFCLHGEELPKSVIKDDGKLIDALGCNAAIKDVLKKVSFRQTCVTDPPSGATLARTQEADDGARQESGEGSRHGARGARELASVARRSWPADPGGALVGRC